MVWGYHGMMVPWYGGPQMGPYIGVNTGCTGIMSDVIRLRAIVAPRVVGESVH